MSKIKKETIEANGFSIQIYTEDFKNDYISLTDIAKYRNSDDPRFVIQNWMRNRNTLEFIGLWEVLNNENFNRVQFNTFISKSIQYSKCTLFNKRSKQWREENPGLKGNIRDYSSLNELLVLSNMESYNAILISKGIEQKERMIELRKLAKSQLLALEKLNSTGIKKLENITKK